MICLAHLSLRICRIEYVVMFNGIPHEFRPYHKCQTLEASKNHCAIAVYGEK